MFNIRPETNKHRRYLEMNQGQLAGHRVQGRKKVGGAGRGTRKEFELLIRARRDHAMGFIRGMTYLGFCVGKKKYSFDYHVRH